MQNYYHILGLSNFATQIEIKNAFRRLAKQYHPDINPFGQEQFKSILKAYEVLSNAYQKTQYDYKLEFQLQQSRKNPIDSKQRTSNKSKDITEQELKRRQYYQEHYKKQYQQSQGNGYVESAKTYNEFKNVLIATPLAVLLIMLLLNVWSDKPQVKVVPYKEEVIKKEVVEAPIKKDIVTGGEPYKEYFGGSHYDTIAKRDLRIMNMSGNDLIVFLFNKNKFIRCCFIEHGYEVELRMLPKELSCIRMMVGANFDYVKKWPKASVYGAFTKGCKLYKFKQKLKLDGSNQITLVNILDQGFVEITEDEFFKKNFD